MQMFTDGDLLKLQSSSLTQSSLTAGCIHTCGVAQWLGVDLRGRLLADLTLLDSLAPSFNSNGVVPI